MVTGAEAQSHGKPQGKASVGAKRSDAQAREIAVWALEQADAKQQRESLEILKNHRFKNPKSPDREKVLYAQAILEERMGRQADAAASFRRLERYFPASPSVNDGLLVLAEDALERKRPKEAEARLKRALASELPIETKRKAQELLLWTLVEANRPQEGIPVIRSLIPLPENAKPSERGLAGIVQVLCAARERDQAEGACKDYLTFYPKGQYRGRVNLAWARLAGSLGDAKDSARSLQQVIQDAPLSPEADEARLALATLLSEGKLPEDAASNFPPPEELLFELGNLEKRSDPGRRALLVRMRLAMGKRDWGGLLAMVGEFRSAHGPESERETVRDLRAKAVAALAQESLEKKQPGAFLPYLDAEGVNSLSADQRLQFARFYARNGLPGPARLLCQLAPAREQPVLRRAALEELPAGLHPEEAKRLLPDKGEAPVESLRRAQALVTQQDWRNISKPLLVARPGAERLEAVSAYLRRPLAPPETAAARAKEADTFLAKALEKGKEREPLTILVADLRARAGDWKGALALYPNDPEPGQKGWVLLMRATCQARLGQKDAAKATLKSGADIPGFKNERDGLGRQLGL
jgi:TolA-binding protein